MGERVSERLEEKLSESEKPVSVGAQKDYVNTWRAFWKGYRAVYEGVAEGFLSRDEARDIVINAYVQMRTHPAAPDQGRWPKLGHNLLDGIDDALEEYHSKPVDVRRQTRAYTNEKASKPGSFLGTCRDILRESAVYRAFVGAAAGSVTALAVWPMLPEQVISKPPSYIVAASLLGAVFGALYGKPARAGASAERSVLPAKKQ